MIMAEDKTYGELSIVEAYEAAIMRSWDYKGCVLNRMMMLRATLVVFGVMFTHTLN